MSCHWPDLQFRPLTLELPYGVSNCVFALSQSTILRHNDYQNGTTPRVCRDRTDILVTNLATVLFFRACNGRTDGHRLKAEVVPSAFYLRSFHGPSRPQ